MNDVPLGFLFAALALLIVLSAAFSASETGMMALNRYRLRHLARHGNPGAIRASRLLERPDRLIGLILLGNNFVNIAASSLATIIGLRLLGEAGIAIAAMLLTVLIIIFAEVAPKTLAALRPERVAFPASFVLSPLLKLAYPLVASVNLIANGLLKLLGVNTSAVDAQHLSTDELRTVVNEAGALISRRFQKMLLSILDLERVVVDDIMVPRNEIVGLDLEDDKDALLAMVRHCQHTRLPVYRSDINNIVGVLHVRRLLQPLFRGALDADIIEQSVSEAHFVPSGTPLSTQLRNFQREQTRIGLVVDEYGDIEGLVTIEDLLEEIVGEFTTDPADWSPDVHPQDDGTFLVDGGASVRDLNRSMHWELPTDGPRTLNGLILEYLEDIPEPGTSLLLSGYPVEVVQTQGNAVRTARVSPELRRPPQPRQPRIGSR